MKRLVLITVLFAGGFALSAQAAVIARINFDGTPTAGATVYTAGPGDILTSCSLVQTAPWPGGVTQPPLSTHNIVTPSVAGFQGGNVMEGNNTGAQRQGLFLTLTNPITTDWTAECIFQTYNLNPPFAEFKIQDIMQAWWIAGSNTRFEVRYFGDQQGVVPKNVVNLTDSNAGGTGEVQANSAIDLITTNTWCHIGLVFTKATNNMSLYLNGGSTPIVQITANSASATPQLGNIVLGAWANDAGSSRDLDGAIDAFALSDQALGPGSFVLPPTYPPARVGEWTLFH